MQPLVDAVRTASPTSTLRYEPDLAVGGCACTVDTEQGFDVVRLESADALAASFAPAVGMTCCSLRDRGEELLADRFGLAAYAGDGISTCMSVMHPWANRLSGWTYTACGTTVRLPVSPRLHTDSWGLPLNGVHSCDAWRLGSLVVGRESAAVDATLHFDSDPARLALFPFPHRLRMGAVLGRRDVTFGFEVDPTSGKPVPVCFGYRMYLRCARPGEMKLVLPARRSLVTDDRLLPTGEAEPREMACYSLGGDELREVFFLGSDRRMMVEAPERRITAELLMGFPLVHVRSHPRESYLIIEALTAAPDALNRRSFALATRTDPYRAALRLSISGAPL